MIVWPPANSVPTKREKCGARAYELRVTPSIAARWSGSAPWRIPSTKTVSTLGITADAIMRSPERECGAAPARSRRSPARPAPRPAAMGMPTPCAAKPCATVTAPTSAITEAETIGASAGQAVEGRPARQPARAAHHRDAQQRQHGGQADAEGDHDRQPPGDLVQRDRGQQHHQRGRAGRDVAAGRRGDRGRRTRAARCRGSCARGRGPRRRGRRGGGSPWAWSWSCGCSCGWAWSWVCTCTWSSSCSCARLVGVDVALSGCRRGRGRVTPAPAQRARERARADDRHQHAGEQVIQG